MNELIDSGEKIRSIATSATVPNEETIDLTTDYGRATIAQKIEYALDEATVAQFDESFRSHLGASIIGEECWRYLWYHFRWFKAEKHDARQLRLFNEEPLVRAELRAIGVEFLDNVDVDGKQISVSELDGHFGGSCDGVFIAPKYGLHTPTLLEVKTSGTGAGFNDLAKKRTRAAKPRHFIQQSVYGRLLNIHYALYFVKNKNDSSRYLDIVELDWSVADEQIGKAFAIIRSQEPPERISLKPEFFICKMCAMNGICHKGAVPVPNCRNCKNATPVPGGRWHCAHFNDLIPKEYLIQGCPQHTPLPR